jgi:hypothetical protein
VGPNIQADLLIRKYWHRKFFTDFPRPSDVLAGQLEIEQVGPCYIKARMVSHGGSLLEFTARFDEYQDGLDGILGESRPSRNHSPQFGRECHWVS